MKILKCNGNNKHNQKLEANLSLTVKRPSILDPQASVKKLFIKQKYINQEFIEAETKQSPRTSQLRGGKLKSFVFFLKKVSFHF